MVEPLGGGADTGPAGWGIFGVIPGMEMGERVGAFPGGMLGAAAPGIAILSGGGAPCPGAGVEVLGSVWGRGGAAGVVSAGGAGLVVGELPTLAELPA